MSIPKPDAESRAYFESLVPDDPRVLIRPMFGNVAAFVNGNMFMGLFGSDVFLRLSPTDRESLLEAGGAPFEPMTGRAMAEYITIPRTWRREQATVGSWVTRSLDYAAGLPPKAKPSAAKRKRS